MKIYTRLISMGLALILSLSALSACGEHGAEHTTHMEEMPTAPSEPVSIQTPTLGPVQTLEPDQGPTPKPVEPIYDPLTDPNVCWGIETDRVTVSGFMAPQVFLGWKLEELLQQVEDESLIAIEISGMVSFSGTSGEYYPEIDLTYMNVPQELDLHGVLTNLVAEYARAETQEKRCELYAQMLIYFYSVANEFVVELDRLEAQIKGELEQKIWQELGIEAKTATNDEAYIVSQRASAEFSGLRLENEEYRQVYETYQTWNELQNIFLDQFVAFYIEEMRLVLTERGFTPVYSTLEENPLPARIAGDYFGTFIGTAAQIKNAEQQIASYEGYHFVLAIKPKL